MGVEELSRRLSRGTAVAFKVGERVNNATGGANAKLKEAVRLSRERIAP